MRNQFAELFASGYGMCVLSIVKNNAELIDGDLLVAKKNIIRETGIGGVVGFGLIQFIKLRFR
jgi:hypothetical protein